MHVKKNVPIIEGAADTKGIEESMTISLVTILMCDEEKETSIKKPSKINS